MTGVIEAIHDKFGFIRGRDGVSRFFIPSALDHAEFGDLAVGMQVEFVHIDHARGSRAIEVTVQLDAKPARSTVDYEE